MSEFKDWDLERQISHIRKCQKEGCEEIRNGSPACLADIADHLDIWGPWLCDKVETLTAQLKIAREKFQQIMEVSGTSTLHYKLAEEGLEELNDRN